MRVIIIEDESKTAKELKAMLNHLDNSIQVEAILPSVAAAIAWLRSNPPPELIFSDIQLGDGLSFEIFRETNTGSPVVFCTAFDEYAIRAFESNSIDYLLKPIEEKKLMRSLEKYNRFTEHLVDKRNYSQQLNHALNQLDPTFKQNILVHYQDKIIPVKVADIKFIYVSGKTVFLYLTNEKNYRLQYTIDQLETMLNPTQFFRANRQFLINREAVKNIEHYFGRRLIVLTDVTPPEKIIIGKVKSQHFLKWIEQ